MLIDGDFGQNMIYTQPTGSRALTPKNEKRINLQEAKETGTERMTYQGDTKSVGQTEDEE